MTKKELLNKIEELHHDWRSLDPQRALERLEFIKVEAMVRALPDDEAQGNDPEIAPCPECGKDPDLLNNLHSDENIWIFYHCGLMARGYNLRDRATAIARWNALARVK